VKFYGTMTLPPGRYELRLMVVDPRSGDSNLRIVRLEVPDFSAGSPELMPPLIPDPVGKWVLARVEPVEGQPEDPWPFQAPQGPFLPAAAPVVNAGDQTPLLLFGRNLGNGELRAEGRLLDASGAVVTELDLALPQQAQTGMAAYEGVMTTFSTAGVKPGDYTLAVTLASDDGGPQTTTIPIVVR
jgi:hypothetical protein